MERPESEREIATTAKGRLARFKGLGVAEVLRGLSAARAGGSLDLKSTPTIYGRAGNLEVRLATTRAEVKLAQRLRYQVFFEEMSAVPSRLAQFRRRDEDVYDAVCDHLLVVDLSVAGDTTSRKGTLTGPKVVGTYRVLRQEVAQKHKGFYSAGEYDICPLLTQQSERYRFMELGRSCVLAPYRTKRTVELLWQGLWAYVRQHNVDVMLGCASFEGTDPNRHAMGLSFLHHNAMAPPQWRARAHDNLYVSMARLPKDQVNAKAALKEMPPLIKGYLRLGAYVGDGAVIDHQFGTTDVFIVLPVENIDPRYFDYFS